MIEESRDRKFALLNSRVATEQARRGRYKNVKTRRATIGSITRKRQPEIQYTNSWPVIIGYTVEGFYSAYGVVAGQAQEGEVVSVGEIKFESGIPGFEDVGADLKATKNGYIAVAPKG